MADIVYFDLETRKTAGDVGGWGHKDKMGISVAVTYSTKTGQYEIYTQDEVDALVDQLRRADLVVGYNHINFDYEVLMGFTVMDLHSQLISLDLMVDCEKKFGFRPKLDNVAEATLGFGKTADGLDAIKWWREGKLLQIAEYCCYDVKVTKMVHEYGVKHGEVFCVDKAQRRQAASVEWTI